MPLKKGKKNISANIAELYADNKKTGKEKGAGGKARPRAQIIAIAMSEAGMSKKAKKMHEKKEGKKCKGKC